MKEIRPGDVISVVVEEKDGFGRAQHYRRKPFKYVVVKLYKHYVLCKRVGTGIKECFTWWDIRTNMVKGGKANASK